MHPAITQSTKFFIFSVKRFCIPIVFPPPHYFISDPSSCYFGGTNQDLANHESSSHAGSCEEEYL
jgi:hypothetical protein